MDLMTREGLQAALPALKEIASVRQGFAYAGSAWLRGLIAAAERERDTNGEGNHG